MTRTVAKRMPWHAGQVLRAGERHGGLILFRRTVRSTNDGEQARLLTEFWFNEGRAWDWMNRIVYLPKSPPSLTANMATVAAATASSGLHP